MTFRQAEEASMGDAVPSTNAKATRRSSRFVVGSALALLLSVGAVGAADALSLWPQEISSIAARRARPEVQSLELMEGAPGVQLEVRASAPLHWTSFRNGEGNLVIELPGTLMSPEVRGLVVDDGLVERVDVKVEGQNAASVVRLVVTTRSETEHALAADGTTLRIQLVPVNQQSPASLAAAPADEDLQPVEEEAPETEVEMAAQPAAAPAESPATAREPMSTETSAPPAGRPASPAGTPDAPAVGPPPAGTAATQLVMVEVTSNELGPVIRILGDGEFEYQTFVLQNPDRFILDLPGVVKATPQSTLEVGDSLVERVRLGQFRSEPVPIARVVVDLALPSRPFVQRGPDDITVAFSGVAVSEQERGTTPARDEDDPRMGYVPAVEIVEESGTESEVETLAARQSETADRDDPESELDEVVVAFTEPLEVVATEVAELPDSEPTERERLETEVGLLQTEIEEAEGRMAGQEKRQMIAAEAPGIELAEVSLPVASYADIALPEMEIPAAAVGSDLAEPAETNLVDEAASGEVVAEYLEVPLPPSAEPEIEEVAVEAPLEISEPVFESVVQLADTTAPPLQDSNPAAMAVPVAPPIPPTDTPVFSVEHVDVEEPEGRNPGVRSFESRSVGESQREYFGEPMDLSVQDADVKDVLRSFAQISGLNIVVQPGVSGAVTVELTQVPWDQALEQILRINDLGYELEGNIMRVAPISKLRQEAQEQQRLKQAQALSIPLRTVIRRISYANAVEIARVISGRGGASIMSRRGSVVVDQRTNTLIIKELPNFMDTVIAVIETLDIPEPQVMIEARIIETTKRFGRTLGIEWGFLGVSSAETGNETGLEFPANGTAAGGVNLLTGGNNGFLSLSMGNILDTFRINATLNAAEDEGLINILSAPKVTTLNNQRAEIQSGLQIPIQTVANNTVSVQFVNATLRLGVTPHVTAEGTILMDIEIQKREPQLAFAVVGATNAPIATKEARTRVIVRDGGTTVIGGIYEVESDRGEDRVPGLASVPVLKHLFKNRRRRDENEELLIFITPRVVNL